MEAKRLQVIQYLWGVAKENLREEIILLHPQTLETVYHGIGDRRGVGVPSEVGNGYLVYHNHTIPPRYLETHATLSFQDIYSGIQGKNPEVWAIEPWSMAGIRGLDKTTHQQFMLAAQFASSWQNQEHWCATVEEYLIELGLEQEYYYFDEKGNFLRKAEAKSLRKSAESS